jgi:hypothetical protein
VVPPCFYASAYHLTDYGFRPVLVVTYCWNRAFLAMLNEKLNQSRITGPLLSAEVIFWS